MAPEQTKTTKNDNSYFSIVMQMRDVRIPSNIYVSNMHSALNFTQFLCHSYYFFMYTFMMNWT